MSNGSLLATLQCIRSYGPLTRSELAQKLGLGFSMVSKLTAQLLERDLIYEAGRAESEGGRPSELLAINPTAGYAIGLDISGEHQRVVLANLRGDVVSRYEQRDHIRPDRQTILDTLAQLIERAIQMCGLQTCSVMGVGVSLWGSVDPSVGTVYSWTETPELTTTWKDFAVRSALQQRWPFPHIIVDDIVRTLGIAEYQYGPIDARQQDFLYALADTGVGLAIMFSGMPYVGPNQLAGEIGHIPIAGGDLPCNCGNTGCLETEASATGILARVQQRLSESSMRTLLRTSESELTIMDVIAAGEDGDKLAYQVLTAAGEHFGSGLAVAINLLGPRLVIVGGVLSKSNVYLDAARRNMKLQALSKASQGVRVESSQLDEYAGARGAAAQVINALFSHHDANLLAVVKSFYSG